MTTSILDTIVATKKQEVTSLPSITPKQSSGSSFIEAILQKQPALIAEIKPKSPSGGLLLQREDIPKFVKLFSLHAQAISVLCDRQYFGGGFDLLAEVRSLTQKPLLAKEFIISTRQIDYAVQNGANAVLLIASILSVPELIQMSSYAIDLNLDVLIEVHSKEEVEEVAKAFNALSKEQKRHILLGINNRNLRTLETDLKATKELAPFAMEQLPGIRCVIAESGIHTREDVVGLQSFVQGFLIGTSILESHDPISHLTSLFAS